MRSIAGGVGELVPPQKTKKLCASWSEVDFFELEVAQGAVLLCWVGDCQQQCSAAGVVPGVAGGAGANP